MRKSEQLNELAAALAQVQGEMEGARKDAKNPFFNSKYANLESVVEASRPALVKWGLSVVQTLGDGPNGVTLISTLLHKSGQWIEGEQPVMAKASKGGEPSPQDYGSAITYARRYGYAALVGVIQTDDDGNGATKNHEDNKGNSSAGKPQGSAASAVAAKTAQAQQALKERHGPGSTKEKTSLPTPRGEEPGKASPAASGICKVRAFSEAEVRAFSEAEADPGEFFQSPAPGKEQNGVPPGAAREGNGRGPTGNAPGVPSPGPNARRADAKAASGEGDAKDVPLSGGASSKPQSVTSLAGKNAHPSSTQNGNEGLPGVRPDDPGSLGNPVVHSGVHGPTPNSSERHGENSGAMAASGGERHNAGIPRGDSKATTSGSKGQAGQPQGTGTVVGGKAIPKTEEEIAWFMTHMKEQLESAKSMTQLAELWNFNAVAVKSLPEAHKGLVIGWKDETKARLR